MANKGFYSKVDKLGIDVEIHEELVEKPEVYGFYNENERWLVYKTLDTGFAHILGELETKKEALDLLYTKLKNKQKHNKWVEKQENN